MAERGDAQQTPPSSAKRPSDRKRGKASQAAGATASDGTEGAGGQRARKTRRQRSPAADAMPTAPDAHADGDVEAAGVIRDLELFLTEHIDHLPTHRHMDEADTTRKRNYWRALIMCFTDRYGAGKADRLLRGTPMLNQLRALLVRVRGLNTRLRKRLAERTGGDRVQMQFPIAGRSLLCITAPEEHGPALVALLVAAIHPTAGVKSLRCKTFEACPFVLPAALQPKLPVGALLKEGVFVEASTINLALRTIFVCAGRGGSGGGMSAGAIAAEYREFVERMQLDSDDGWDCFEGLPPEWSDRCKFSTTVPVVRAGEQVGCCGALPRTLLSHVCTC
jgi:hypothetical protein